MNNADLNSGTPLLHEVPNPMLQSLARGLTSPQLGAMLTLAAAITLGAGLIVWGMRPDFVPVAEQGSRQDALQIIEMLKSAQVDYRLDPSTGLVLVPKDQAAQVQMNLAASGLAQAEAVGLEMLQQKSSLGTSHFTETARYQHALETELSRTISSMRNVESARVHLALPKQSVFIRDRTLSSASVMIQPKSGRSIEEEQVNSVVNLVASSIPYLETGQVTVVDQWGRLLSKGDDSASGVSRDQYQYTRKLEKLYADRIETLLSTIVGAGRVRATVTADIDFSTNERTQESFEPDPAKLRSEQTESQSSDSPAAVGIPGALTNQAPGNGTTDAAGDTTAAATQASGNQTSSVIRNYELDKTITHVRQASGNILRLSAAVIIDDRMSVDESGTAVRTPLTEQELAEYTALAREAVGFKETRGDSVVVFNRSFQPAEEIQPIEPLPIWKQSWLWNMVRQSFIGLSVLLLVLLVLRPAVKRLSAPVYALAGTPSSANASPHALSGVGNDQEKTQSDSSALASPPVVYGDILNMARVMAADDPKRVAKVVKDWVSEQ